MLAAKTLFAITFLAISLTCHASIVYAQSEESASIDINLKNASIHSLIETVSSRTGKNFIVDPRVKATVTVVSLQPVGADQLYDLFLSVLDVHGFAAVDSGNFIKIVPTAMGVQSAVPVIKAAPGSGDELVTEVVHVKNLPAVQMVEALRGLLPATASISAETHTNTIIITDRAANIAKLAEVIRLLEHPQ